ncbi:delta-3,5-delta-2,4-dienoyl-CoA isomerase [Aureococcus anophagefferens]|nr:delta-3,5-delta-2,4-dienoyl-CoA isomerase [Aureococcus anophagefferens]
MYLADHELDAQQALESGCVHRISSDAGTARRFARRDASASGRSVEATDARLIQETLLNGEASGAVSEALFVMLLRRAAPRRSLTAVASPEASPPGSPPSSPIVSPLLSPPTSPVTRQSRALETVASICAAVAGAHVDAQGPLMEAGVDSLGAAEIVGRLTAEFERELPATLLFDHPTAAAIAAFLQPRCVLEPLDLGPPLLPLDPASPDEGLSLRWRGDGIAVVTYDRPDRSNAAGVRGAPREPPGGPLRRRRRRRDRRDGRGSRLCAGAQFDSFLRRDPRAARDDVRDLSRALFDAFLDASKPVVAAVNGAAIGGGATQAALCDETLASTAAAFSWPFRRWRAAPKGCASAHLARAVGAGAARAALRSSPAEARPRARRREAPRPVAGRAPEVFREYGVANLCESHALADAVCRAAFLKRRGLFEDASLADAAVARGPLDALRLLESQGDAVESSAPDDAVAFPPALRRRPRASALGARDDIARGPPPPGRTRDLGAAEPRGARPRGHGDGAAPEVAAERGAGRRLRRVPGPARVRRAGLAPPGGEGGRRASPAALPPRALPRRARGRAREPRRGRLRRRLGVARRRARRGHRAGASRHGLLLAVAAGRVSFVFGLVGPSLPVDTACSASLVALHVGAAALGARECARCVVAGEGLLEAAVFEAFAAAGMLSPSGAATPSTRGPTATAAARAASRRASRSGGNGRRAAVRQDGASASLTAPNGTSQRRLLRVVLDRAAVAPASLEAHGTGTALGDPSRSAPRRRARGVGSPPRLVRQGELGPRGTRRRRLGLRAARRDVPLSARAAPTARLRRLNTHLVPIAAPERAALVLGSEEAPPSGIARATSGNLSSFGFSGTIAHANFGVDGDASRGRGRDSFGASLFRAQLPLQSLQFQVDLVVRAATEQAPLDGIAGISEGGTVGAILFSQHLRGEVYLGSGYRGRLVLTFCALTSPAHSRMYADPMPCLASLHLTGDTDTADVWHMGGQTAALFGPWSGVGHFRGGHKPRLSAR